jgi:hypothetical protein
MTEAISESLKYRYTGNAASLPLAGPRDDQQVSTLTVIAKLERSESCGNLRIQDRFEIASVTLLLRENELGIVHASITTWMIIHMSYFLIYCA